LEAVVLVGLFAVFHVGPPLAPAAVLAFFFVLLCPVYLGWRHGVFKDLLHISLVCSVGRVGRRLSWPLPRILWIYVLAAVSTA
jgi:hypothetical protein